jgi:hypothetical protein
MGSALYYATAMKTSNDHPKVSSEVIVMLIKDGARIDSALLEGLIQLERTDVLDLLVSHGNELRFDRKFLKDEKTVKECSKATGKKETIEKVNRIFEIFQTRLKALKGKQVTRIFGNGLQDMAKNSLFVDEWTDE